MSVPSLSVYVHPYYSGITQKEYDAYIEIRNKLGVIRGDNHLKIASRV